MIKHLITGGCSFSTDGGTEFGWTGKLANRMKKLNHDLTYEHTGYLSQGQEMIQKKVMLAIMDELAAGTSPDEILACVMWSGAARKAWYIDNPDIIREMVNGWPKFQGGMSSQFLDLKNAVPHGEDVFQTNNGTKFDYNKSGGWYFTVDGSDCQLGFVRQFYMIDKNTCGVGKVHSSLENIIALQNFCKLHGVKLIQQFFMDIVFDDIEKSKDHQIIKYLYNQLDFESMITGGMFEHLHSLIGIPNELARITSHSDRLIRDKEFGYFSSDGFHPSSLIGAQAWCNDILFPFLDKKL